jgi:hypothetical protein
VRGKQDEHLWSDDDDYDALSSEFMEQGAMQGQQQNLPPAPSQDYEAMEMS